MHGNSEKVLGQLSFPLAAIMRRLQAKAIANEILSNATLHTACRADIMQAENPPFHLDAYKLSSSMCTAFKYN